MWRLAVLALTTHLLAASLAAQDPRELRSAVDAWLKVQNSEPAALRHAFADLDGDGRPDAVVLLIGNAWCGSGGCTMLVFRGTGTGFTFVSSMEFVSEPIRVLPETTYGWKNLIVYMKKLGDVVIRSVGTGYSDDSPGSAATAAQIKAAQTIMEPCCVSLYTSEVQFQSFGQPPSIELKDGQDLRVAFPDIGGLTLEDIEKWSDGKRLLIIYSLEEGASLLDPDSLKSVPILWGLKTHPIDAMADKCIQSDAQTTAEMAACFVKGLSMWDKEMNRVYGQLISSLSPAQKQSVQAAQRQWLLYRDAEKAAFDSVLENAGTLSRVTRASEAMRLTKEQAERLARLLAP